MKKSKTIWVLLRSHFVNLPPIMTVMQCLLDFEEYQVKFVSTQASGLSKENLQEFILPQSHKVNKLTKLKNYIDYRSFVKKTLSKFASNEDLIWLGSLDTARACKGLEFLETNEYILHLHELYDTHRGLLESIKPIAQKAKKVVSPEINRAAILQVWLELKERPIVFPNKPYSHPRTKRIQPTHEKTKAILEKFATDKPIILYQGHIGGDRNLMPIAAAMKELPEYEFWLMGPDHGYAESLVKVSNNIKYLGMVPAPFHLEITSYASIGIMSYDLINLNNLYCAPNKVWEYCGFGIPFISNHCISLEILSEINKIGIVIYWTTEKFKNAVNIINQSYNLYMDKNKDFFEDNDIKSIVEGLLV